MPEKSEKTYILFEKKTVVDKPQMMILSYDALAKAIQQQMMGVPEGEEWRNGEGNESKKPKVTKAKTRTVLEYIATVSNPSEVAKIVRSAPLKEYALFEGVLRNISVQMPVMIDGIAADSLSSEWAADPSALGFDPSIFNEIDETKV